MSNHVTFDPSKIKITFTVDGETITFDGHTDHDILIDRVEAAPVPSLSASGSGTVQLTLVSESGATFDEIMAVTAPRRRHVFVWCEHRGAYLTHAQHHREAGQYARDARCVVP